MNEYATFNKEKPFTRFNCILIAVLAVLMVAVLLVTLLPRDSATYAIVYVEGREVSRLDLSSQYNKVASYNGVLVRVDNGAVQTVYGDRVANLTRTGDSIVYPTLGVSVELK
jgi:hypothetical protein